MKALNLFVVLLGGRQKDDKLEAHNFFTGAAGSIEELLPQIKRSWKGVTHIDAYMKLEVVDGYHIIVTDLKQKPESENTFPKLLIYNIGYYKPGEFAEFHKLIPMVLENENDPWRERLKSDPDFAAGQSFDDIARSHVDDTFKLNSVRFDADDIIEVQKEISNYSIELVPVNQGEKAIQNTLEFGYLFVKELKEIK